MVSPRLHPRTIDAVKERADIVDVVGEHVVLKNVHSHLVFVLFVVSISPTSKWGILDC